MIASLPGLLALIGTALSALAIFAPRQVRPSSVAVSALIATPELSGWAAAVDPSVADSAPHARIALAEALGTLGTPWARELLHQALVDEPDPAVRSALAASLDASERDEAFVRRPR